MAASELGLGVRAAITDLAVKTNDDGRWSCPQMPADLDKVKVRVQWNDAFIQRTLTFTKGGEYDLSQLRDGSGVIVLQRWGVLTGAVLDETGCPLAGASVRVQCAGEAPASARRVACDQWGRFILKRCRPGELIASAQCDAHAPRVKRTNMTNGAVCLELCLGEGRKLDGLVTGADGEALAGALVSVASLDGLQGALTWRCETDAQGRFTWDNAPDGALVLRAVKPGFQPAEVPVKPGGPVDIQLAPQPKCGPGEGATAIPARVRSQHRFRLFSDVNRRPQP